LRQERANRVGRKDHHAQLKIERELRYWIARHSTAQVVVQLPGILREPMRHLDQTTPIPARGLVRNH
jgi:hypothetical protein